MRVILTRSAKAELAEAVNWYDARLPEAADRFVDEFEALKNRLMQNPRQFPAVRRDIHRAGFRSFPYGLFFRIREAEDRVEIFGCFHASRNPRHWQG